MLTVALGGAGRCRANYYIISNIYWNRDHSFQSYHHKIFPWLINKGLHSPLEVYSSFLKAMFEARNVILNSPWYPVAVSRAYMKNTKISILRIVLVFLRLKEILLHSLWSLFRTDNILITTTLWTTKQIQQHLLDLMTLNLCRENISFEPQGV